MLTTTETTNPIATMTRACSIADVLRELPAIFREEGIPSAEYLEQSAMIDGLDFDAAALVRRVEARHGRHAALGATLAAARMVFEAHLRAEPHGLCARMVAACEAEHEQPGSGADAVRATAEAIDRYDFTTGDPGWAAVEAMGMAGFFGAAHPTPGDALAACVRSLVRSCSEELSPADARMLAVRVITMLEERAGEA